MEWLRLAAPKIKAWVEYHICSTYHCATALPGHGEAFTFAVYFFLLALGALGYLFLMYLVFLVMGWNKRTGKTQAWRKVLLWVLFAFLVLSAAAIASTLWAKRLIKDLGGAYEWIVNCGRGWAALFKPNGALHGLVFSGHSNPYIFGLFYYCLLVLILEIVILCITHFVGKPKAEPVKEESAIPAPTPAYTEEVKPVEEKKEEPTPAPVAAAIAKPEEAKAAVAVDVAKEAEPVKPEKIVPTVRELALLNSLEPLKPSHIASLPGIYPTEEEKIVADLEPTSDHAVDEEEKEHEAEDKALKDSLGPVDNRIKVLPAVDEWGADPWKDEEEKPAEEVKPVEEAKPVEPAPAPVAEEKPTEEAKPVEEKPAQEEKPVEAAPATEAKPVDITEEAKPEEEKAPVLEEVKPAETKEAKPAEEVKKTTVVVAPNDLPADDKRPQEETSPKDYKATGEDRSELKSVVANNDHEAITTEPSPIKDAWVLPPYVPEEKPVEEEKPAEAAKLVEEAKPVEEKPTEEPKPEEAAPAEEGKATEEAKPVNPNEIPAETGRLQEEKNENHFFATGEDRSKLKEVHADNSHEEVVTEKPSTEDTWKLPPYVEEKKPEPASKPAQEKKPLGYQPSVKPVALKQVNPNAHPNKPHGPIGVVTPIVHEEKKPVEEAPVEEAPVEEEKKLAPVTGPLHSTEKSKHEKIEAVKARRVRFELKNYQIKTYQGDLTPEQAFEKGVTKVQPKVRPTFANESAEPTWKAKRREEDIRKNGYTNVTQVEKLNGVTPVAPKPIEKKPTSIREMVKMRQQEAQEAKKAEEAKPAEEEKKPIKPIKPVAVPVKPVEPKPEEKKEDIPNTKEFFHPIAPIAKKPTKRPDIKPIDPNKRSH